MRNDGECDYDDCTKIAHIEVAWTTDGSHKEYCHEHDPRDDPEVSAFVVTAESKSEEPKA